MSSAADFNDPSVWKECISDFECGSRVNAAVAGILDSGAYEEIAELIDNGRYMFSVPREILVPKPGSDKKRKVFSFGGCPQDRAVLSIASKMFRQYDSLFAPNLHSYRTTRSVRTAVRYLAGTEGLERMYAYKADISDYFNSVDTEGLLAELRGSIDPSLYGLMRNLLSDRRVMLGGKLENDPNKGVMAGVSTSSFLSNFYLRDMDWEFHRSGAVYCRFADDIIVFAESEEKVVEHADAIRAFVRGKGLSINPSKEHYYRPGETVEFLGIAFRDGKADIGSRAMKRIKSKIKRKAAECRRNAETGLGTSDCEAKRMVRWLNGNLYGMGAAQHCWSDWYFGLLTDTRGMKAIDAYAQQCIRYVLTGSFGKKAVKQIPYRKLREAGYVPLVSAFYGGA